MDRLLEETDNPEQVRAALLDRQPIGRLARQTRSPPRRLASDEAGFITDSTLVIDGGLTAA